MTPERMKDIKDILTHWLQDADKICGVPKREFLELCDAALRLAAIENVGDEEVESLHESFYKLLPLNTLEARRCGAFDTACELLKERNQVVAELRAKLGERESLLRTLYDSPSIGEIANDDTYYRLEKFIAESEVGGG